MNAGQKVLESAQVIIRKTAEKMGLDEEMIKRLIEPEFAHEFCSNDYHGQWYKKSF